MGILFKIGLAILVALYLRSCVTNATMEHLPKSMPSLQSMPSLPSLQDIHLPAIPDFPSFNKSEESAPPPPPADTTERIALKSATPNSLAVRPDCVTVNSSFGRSMLKDASQIKNMQEPRQWEILNKSNRTLAIVLGQEGVVVAVAYVAKQQSYTSKIPSNGLQFVIKHTDDNCISHRMAGGLPMFDPFDLPSSQGQIQGGFVTEVNGSGKTISIFNSPIDNQRP